MLLEPGQHGLLRAPLLLCPRQEPGEVGTVDVGKRATDIRAILVDPRQRTADLRRRPGRGLAQPLVKALDPGQGERRGDVVVALGGVLIEEVSQLVVERRAVAQRGELIGPAVDGVVTLGHDRLGVVLQEPGEHRVALYVDAVLVAAQDRRPHGVKAAEVEETQRASVHRVHAVAVLQRALVEVPVSKVELGITHDRKVREEPGHQVEPTLIHEVPPGRIHPAVAPQPVRPPVENLLHLGPRGQRHVAEVVDARDHHVDLAGATTVLGNGLAVVRDEGDAVGSRPLIE